MDEGMPINVYDILLDALSHTPGLAVGQRHGRRPKGRARRCEAGGEGDLVLVAKDQLYFRVAPCARGPGPSGSSAGGPGPRERAVGRAFRDAFRAVWGRLPEPERQRLLDHWSCQESARDYGPLFSSGRQPVIRVVPGGSADDELLCAKSGHELTFPDSLAADHPDRPRAVIARALALVMRLANRRHWQLVQELIQVPLEAWERSRGRVSDAARDRKLDVLEKPYLRAYEAEVREILSRWGFAEPPPGERQSGRGERETGEG